MCSLSQDDVNMTETDIFVSGQREGWPERNGQRSGERDGGRRERERDTKRHTSLPYLHVAAAMTGNLAKFSTELAADGEGIERERGKSKGTMEVKEEMCGRGRVPTA